MKARALAAAATWLLFGAHAGADPTTPGEGLTEAIWVAQRVDYTFESSNTYYACSSLKQKLATMLEAVGAHASAIEVRCLGGRLVNRARAEIVAVKPVQATPENVAAATTYDSRTRLLAQVKAVQLPTANDVDRFSASWQTISLHRRTLGLGAEDCDLLRDFSAKVFPQLEVRIVDNGLRCSSGVPMRMKTNLVVQALVPTASIPVARTVN